MNIVSRTAQETGKGIPIFYLGNYKIFCDECSARITKFSKISIIILLHIRKVLAEFQKWEIWKFVQRYPNQIFLFFADCWYPGFRNPRPWPIQTAPNNKEITGAEHDEDIETDLGGITEDDFVQ